MRHAFRYTRFFFPLPYPTPQPHVSPTITLRRIHLRPQSKRYKSHTKCSRAIKLPLALFVFPIQSSGTVFFAFCLVGLFPSISLHFPFLLEAKPFPAFSTYPHSLACPLPCWHQTRCLFRPPFTPSFIESLFQREKLDSVAPLATLPTIANTGSPPQIGLNSS